MRKTFFLWFLLFIFLTTYNYNIKDSPIFSYFDVKEIEILGINNSNKKITPCAKVANVGSLSANEKWPQIYLQVSICYFCDKYNVF